ncbi:Rne/Rng family ribonuclease [bacterium]|nr:Rne/Rng family ribonuclease [bacterium]
MQTRIIINSQVHESRIGILEDRDLVEVQVERPDTRRIVGNIYKGKVENILREIQAAFVDIGLEKRAFLHISDISSFDAFLDSEVEELSQPTKHHRKERIENLIKPGDDILIQIIKEPIGSKGPKATTQLTMAGRYLVMIPGAEHVGVSRHIRNRQQRRRLQRIAHQFKTEGIGLIVRTIAEKQKIDVLQQDFEHVFKNWETLKKKAEALPAPSLVYKDIGLAAKLVRDFFSSDVEELVIDSKEEYQNIRNYLEKVAPHLLDRVKLYKGKQPIFDEYGIESQISEMLSRKVQVAQGIYIVIDRTEAMAVIDINAGRFSGSIGHDESILKANVLAMEEIGKQLRLRDIGGIIVIDFIDMESEECKRKLLAEIKRVIRNDRSTIRFSSINEFGLVTMTRKRIRPSVIQSITEICPVCGGSGILLSSTSVITLLERFLMRAHLNKYQKLIVIAHPNVCAEFIQGEPSYLEMLESSYKIKMKLLADITIANDQFMIIDANSGEDITNKFIA